MQATPHEPTEEAALSSAVAGGARILVVEDEMIVAKDICSRLQGMGYSVVGTAASGSSAVALAEEHTPELVLMDVMLKGEISGTQAAEMIREKLDLPVVFLTAYSDRETLEKARTSAYGYVLKPFEERELQTSVEIALYKHRSEQELERQRGLAVRADRLRSLGEMAAGIAHELSQPLVAVRGLAEHILIGLERGWDISEKTAKDRLQVIIDQADRMTHIIDHVRTFSREAGKLDRSPVQINDVIRSALEMVEAQFRSHGVSLTCELANELPILKANPYSLEEVLLNLLSNARESVEDRLAQDPDGCPGEVSIRTGLRRDDSARGLVVEVTDNGLGISPEVGDRVFEPFYTTKGPDRGTGLGLSVSRGIVEEFGGTIQVRSTPGQRTVFSVLLPAG